VEESGHGLFLMHYPTFFWRNSGKLSVAGFRAEMSGSFQVNSWEDNTLMVEVSSLLFITLKFTVHVIRL
jgi:hypothetical protein